jgi:hypothetical protein
MIEEEGGGMDGDIGLYPRIERYFHLPDWGHVRAVGIEDSVCRACLNSAQAPNCHHACSGVYDSQQIVDYDTRRSSTAQPPYELPDLEAAPVCSSGQPPDGSRWLGRGFVDSGAGGYPSLEESDGIVEGWACNPDLAQASQSLPTPIDIEVDGFAIAALPARDVRVDVNQAAWVDCPVGAHGFTWKLPDKLCLARDATGACSTCLRIRDGLAHQLVVRARDIFSGASADLLRATADAPMSFVLEALPDIGAPCP